MGALLGSLSATCIAFSDLFGRRVIGKSSVLTTAVVMQFVAIFGSMLPLLVIAGEPRADDLIRGGLSGLGLGVGLACYYGGITRSSSTVVAPLVATMSAVVPFTYTVVTGGSASVFAIMGAAVAVGGLVLITIGGRAATAVWTGLAWGLVSGAGYGFGLTVVIDTASESGAWPAVTQRMAAFALMIVLAGASRAPMIPPKGARLSGFAAGLLAAGSTIFYLAGVQADAGPAVITAAMFPAGSVAVGRFFYSDPVSRPQIIGIGAVLLGTVGVVMA